MLRGSGVAPRPGPLFRPAAPCSTIARQLSAAGVYCHWGDNYAFEVARALNLDPDEGVLRLGLAHYNTLDEVDQGLAIIRETLAA